MEWQRKARKALVSPELVYFLWLAKMATPRTGHLWPKCFVKSIIHILIIIFVVACCILSILSCKWQTALYCVWICILAKFRADVLFASRSEGYEMGLAKGQLSCQSSTSESAACRLPLQKNVKPLWKICASQETCFWLHFCCFWEYFELKAPCCCEKIAPTIFKKSSNFFKSS